MNGSGFPSIGGGSGSTSDADNPYHLIQNIGMEGVGLTTSNAYNEIFGDKNSSESIFELQFDGTVNSNTMVQNFYQKPDKNGVLVPSVIATTLSSSADDASNAALFSKTDLRRWASIQDAGDDSIRYCEICSFCY